MMRSILRGMAVLVATGGLVTLSVTSASAHSDDHEVHQTVRVVGHGSSVDLSTHSVYAGSIRFEVSSTNPQTMEGGGSTVSLFRLKPGRTLTDFFTGLRDEFSQDPATAAKGTRELVATVIVRGLADVVPGHPAVVTQTLRPATYYAMDLGNQPTGPPKLTTLAVRGGGDDIAQRSDLRNDLQVTTVDDRFRAPAVWPHKGTYRFANHSDTIHLMLIQPVKAGTTDRDVQAFFDAIRQHRTDVAPPFTPGPTGGNDVVSPGYRLQLTYDLPPGRYVLLCFVADDVTGLPHAFMGMHQVVVLK